MGVYQGSEDWYCGLLSDEAIQTDSLMATFQKNIMPPCLPVYLIYTLNMEAVCSSETSETTCHITRCENTEDWWKRRQAIWTNWIDLCYRGAIIFLYDGFVDNAIKYFDIMKCARRRTEHEGKWKDKRSSCSPGTFYVEAVREIRTTKLLVNFEKWNHKFQETWSNVL